MKPTMFDQCGTASNQIPSAATIRGDIRIGKPFHWIPPPTSSNSKYILFKTKVPFYNALEVQSDINKWVKEINENISSLESHGYSYTSGNFTGRISLEWIGDLYFGVYCDMESVGYKALEEASRKVLGTVKPFSVCGSLPCVKDLQDNGFDLQMMGYGVEEVYHADNGTFTLDPTNHT